MKPESARLSPTLFLLAVAGSLSLIAVSLFFLVDTVAASKLFGVPLSSGPGAAYVSVAAVRDLSIGGLALVFSLLRDRRALGITLLLSALIPVGDGVIVLENSPTPMTFLPLHWGGAVACLAFALFLLLGARKT